MLRSNSFSLLMVNATPLAYASTCTEWSITKSHGTSGFTRLGSPPIRCIAPRIAAKSTTHGTPVKSCNTTRPGINGISSSLWRLGSLAAIAFTCSSVYTRPSTLRNTLSSNTLMEYGSRSTSPNFFSAERL